MAKRENVRNDNKMVVQKQKKTELQSWQAGFLSENILVGIRRKIKEKRKINEQQ